MNANVHQHDSNNNPHHEIRKKGRRSLRRKVFMWGLFGPLLACLVWFIIYLLPLPLHWFESDLLQPQEQIVLFVTVAQHPEDILKRLKAGKGGEEEEEEDLRSSLENNTFAVPVHGWVYEPGWHPFRRLLLTSLFHLIQHLSPEPQSSVPSPHSPPPSSSSSPETSEADDESTTALLSGTGHEEHEREHEHPHLHELKRTLEEDMSVFFERGSLFLVDNNRGKRLSVRICGKVYGLSVLSSPNGHFRDHVHVPILDLLSAESCPGRQGDILKVEVLALSSSSSLEENDEEEKDNQKGEPSFRVFDGQVMLLREKGVSVISDIDDTIKVTEITNKHLMFRNTFISPFRPVPNFARTYSKWIELCESSVNASNGDPLITAVNNIAFHYVSLSPWQLFSYLSDFLQENGFPPGSLHLRLLRLLEPSVLNFFKTPRESKRQVLVPLFRQFPRRRFVLVGDTTELDPEIYAELASEFPAQIRMILIRDTEKGAKNHIQRVERIRSHLPTSISFVLFQEPGELLEPSVLSLFPCRPIYSTSSSSPSDQP